MNIFRQYRAVILIICVILLAVTIKSTSHNFFRPDAVKHAASSFSGDNIITIVQLEKLNGEKLIVNLDGSSRTDNPGYIQINVPADSVLEKPWKRQIFNHKGFVILSSADKSESAAVWMVLSQLGRDNLLVLN